MRLRLFILWSCIVAVVFGALGPDAARAGTFSAPVRLPGTFAGWQFAINDHGYAVGVASAEAGTLVYPLGTSTRLGGPWRLTVPGGYPAGTGPGAVALDERLRIAVALYYDDNTTPPSDEPHGNSGCCGRAAIASWRLGEQPPLAQSLSSRLSAEEGFAPNLPPSVTIGRSSVTAIWTAGGVRVAPEPPGQAKLREAFGQFGRPLHIVTLMAAPNGIPFYTLSSASNGDPTASWLDDGNKIRSVTGLRNGALRHSRHAQPVHGLTEGSGFTTDGSGDTVFAYLSGSPEQPRKLLIITSRSGHPFGSPRLVTSIPANTAGSGSVLAGSDGSLLGLWQWFDRASNEYLRASLGGLASPFAKASSVPGEFPVGLFGEHGEAIVVYEAPQRSYKPDGSPNLQLAAITARRGHRFGRPRRIAPELLNCGLPGGNAPEPIVTNPRGDAILTLTCEGGSEYMVRYTP